MDELEHEPPDSGILASEVAWARKAHDGSASRVLVRGEREPKGPRSNQVRFPTGPRVGL